MVEPRAGKLTPAEVREVRTLIAFGLRSLGYSPRQIGRILGISHETARAYLRAWDGAVGPKGGRS